MNAVRTLDPVAEFHAPERERVAVPHQPEPLADLFQKLSECRSSASSAL